MQITMRLAAVLCLLASSAGPTAVRADSSDASCEVRKASGERGSSSGSCRFSQRQGYVDIALSNGETYSLRPGTKADHFHDAKGHKVIRTQAGGNTQTFQWEGGKTITVHFRQSGHASGSSHSQAAAGDTVSDLADLVGARAGQAEGDLQRRGYAWAKGSTAGSAKYASWWNASKRQCAMIRTEDGRYQSIVHAPASDCGHSAHASAAHADAGRAGTGDEGDWAS